MNHPISSPPKSRVSNACQRCMRQKLKCDAHRPCTLCVRAGVACSAIVKSTAWNHHDPDRYPRKTTTQQRSLKKRSVKHAGRRSLPVPPSSIDLSPEGDRHQIGPVEATSTSWTSNSAARQFVTEAFHQHHTVSPDGQETSALSATHWTHRYAATDDLPASKSSREHDEPSSVKLFESRATPAIRDILALLPGREPATMIVDSYFKRIHWFVLVFHQHDFRERFQQLYNDLGSGASHTSSSLGFVALCAAVYIVSMQYMNAPERHRLSENGVTVSTLQHQLLTTLRLRLFDIVSQGSMEAVQTCVLLGSYYLYHGEPESAWPICGSGLRVAQALNLHRRQPSQVCGSPDLDNPQQRAEETRKRCWWALYEVETFSSMLYGFPFNIKEEDCDIELLDQYPRRTNDPSWQQSVWRQKGQATLLSYKLSMSQLSLIIKSTLADLYSLRARPTASNTSALHLAESVRQLDRAVLDWHRNLPQQLRIEVNETTIGSTRGHSSFPDPDQGSQEFNDRLFQLQALALKIAFENTRILIHRPLLSYKIAAPRQSCYSDSEHRPMLVTDPCLSSVRTCREAALQVSHINSLPIFENIADTYAVSFVALHLLSAAVTLSISASLNPMSQESHNCKLGLHRLVDMQAQMRSKSIVAEQGFAVLKKLLRLVLLKEAELMLQFPERENVICEETGTYSHDQRELLGDSQVLTIERRESESRQDELGDPLQIGTSIAATSLPDPASQLDFEFFEDPVISQAVAEFEKAINWVPIQTADDEISNDSYMDNVSGGYFGSQDQSWIWAFNPHSSA